MVVDSLQAASAVAGRAQAQGEIIPALIEIDCDGHRAGVQPGNTEQLLAIARELHGAGCLRGVMTHAGESYGCRSVEAIADMAEQERRAAVSCADAIRAAGLPCPVVSVGSTPTAHFARSLEGVTEVRAGVYVFFDLVMAGLGVCRRRYRGIGADHGDRTSGRKGLDPGGRGLDGDVARSRHGKQPVDQLYGLVCDAQGRPYPDLLLAETNQEQGIIKLRAGSGATLPDLPLGANCASCPIMPAPPARSMRPMKWCAEPRPRSSRTGNVSAAGEPRLDWNPHGPDLHPDATPPAGHYSQAVRANGFVFSGQHRPGRRLAQARRRCAAWKPSCWRRTRRWRPWSTSLFTCATWACGTRSTAFTSAASGRTSRRAPSCRPANCITARWLKSAPSRWQA